MELHQKLKQEFPFLRNIVSLFSIKDHDKASNYTFSYHNNHHLDHHRHHRHHQHYHHLNPFNGSASFNPQNIHFNPLTTIEASSQNPLFRAYPTTCNTHFHLNSLTNDHHQSISSYNHLSGFGGVFLDNDQNKPISSFNHTLGFQQKFQDQTHLFSPFKIEVFQLNNSKAPVDEISCITTDKYDQLQNNNKKGKINDENKVHKKKQIIKGQWTIEEDRLLVKMVRKHGEKKWSQIAKVLPGRIGKQCRERWHNHLRPDIRKDAWSEKEDRILIEAHKVIGNKWSEIAKRLVGRTENTIKNHWNATKRKQFCKGKTNDSTSTLLRNYIKSLTSPPVIQDQPTNSIEETSELIGLHSQMEYSEDLNALMNYDIDESKYTLGSCFFNDLNDGFLSLPQQVLPSAPAVEETDLRDLDMLELESLIKDDGNEKDMDLVELFTQGSV